MPGCCEQVAVELWLDQWPASSASSGGNSLVCMSQLVLVLYSCTHVLTILLLGLLLCTAAVVNTCICSAWVSLMTRS